MAWTTLRLSILNIPMYLLVTKLCGGEVTIMGYLASLGLGMLLTAIFIGD